MIKRVVILGAGHAGVQAASSLRDEGYEGPIALIDSQSALPYQRPPLSKAYLKGETTPERIVLKSAQFYAEQRIDLMLSERAESIDSVDRKVTLQSGTRLDYDKLILATGARSRALPVEGHALQNVLYLRDLADAQALKEALPKADNILVIGAGFIGLEFAAVAAARGAKVTVIEMQSRVMARAISPVMSEAFEEKHRQLGVTFHFGAGLARFVGNSGKLVSVELSDGTSIKADLAVVGIGVLAKDRLAAEAGLAVGNGIVVDGQLRSSHTDIFAIGDNNTHPNPFYGDRLRLESVQNAVDQAKHVAAVIIGKKVSYRALPWFWTDQADDRLQIAGVAKSLSHQVVRGDRESGSFSVLGFEGDRLAVVESLNKPADHMLARRLIDAGISPTPDEAADLNVDLKAMLAKPRT